MVIYADILLLTNLYIDFLLLVCVRKFLRLRVSTLRLLPGALVGAALSLCALLPQLPTALSLLLGFLGAGCISAAAFAPGKWSMLLKASAAYWCFSFIFAGFCLFIYHFVSPKNLMIRNGLVYFPISPLSLFIFTLLAYLVLSIFRRLFAANEKGPDYCRFRVTGNGKEAVLFAKADTGNSLKEPFSGLPVMVAEASALKGIAPQALYDFLETGQPQEKLRLIPFAAIGGTGLLPAFQADSVRSAKCETPLACYIALFAGKLSAGQFNALYHPGLLEFSSPSALAQANGKSNGARKETRHATHHEKAAKKN